MKVDFTKEEADSFLSLMREEHDLVRLVDPAVRRVLTDEGRNTEDVCHMVWGRCGRCENCTSLRAIQGEKTYYKLETKNSSTYWVCSRFLRLEGKPMILELVTDITDQLIMDSDERNEIGTLISNFNHKLITDSLTNVYNRRFLDEHFLPSLRCCHEEGILVNLAFLDMDDFKKVNDRYGHSAGDSLLCDVAGFWQLHFDSREAGRERLVVRFGGDEMLVIAVGISKAQFEHEISNYSREMRKICYLPDHTQFNFNFTYGISSTEELPPDWNWDELLELADKRMYQIKEEKAQKRL